MYRSLLGGFSKGARPILVLKTCVFNMLVVAHGRQHPDDPCLRDVVDGGEPLVWGGRLAGQQDVLGGQDVVGDASAPPGAWGGAGPGCVTGPGGLRDREFLWLRRDVARCE